MDSRGYDSDCKLIPPDMAKPLLERLIAPREIDLKVNF
jgi:hypothetical protein